MVRKARGQRIEKPLTATELEMMNVIWRIGPCSVLQIVEQLRPERELAYTSVSTIVRILEQKGYVKHEEEGRVHRYFAAVKEDAARKSALQHLTGKLFKGSAELLFTHLVADRKLSKVQIERMRELLASAGKKEK